MSKKFAILCAGLLLCFSACRHTRNVTKTETPPPSSNSIQALTETLEKNALSYQWLRMKTSLSYEDPSNSYSAATQIKLHKDELIWGSVSVLIEVARAQINKDSATMLNRTNKTFTSFPVMDLQQMLAIQNLDLSALQRLLLAAPPFGIDRDSKLTTTDNLYQVEHTTPAYKEAMDISSRNMRLSKYRYERNANEYLEVNYSDFTEVDGKTLPKKIEITVARPDKIKITLDVSDYTFLDSDEAPFSIPTSYKRSQ
jgi:hypothetical protein